MTRLVSSTIVVLASLGVISLVVLPLLAREAAERTHFARPEALPEEPQLPEKREESLVPVSELHEALRLPSASPDRWVVNGYPLLYETTDLRASFE